MPTAKAIDWDVIDPEIVLGAIENLGVVGMITAGAPHDEDERTSAYLAVLMAVVQAQLLRRRDRHNELINVTYMRAHRWLGEARSHEAVGRLRVAGDTLADHLQPWFRPSPRRREVTPEPVHNAVHGPTREVKVDPEVSDHRSVRVQPRHADDSERTEHAAETGCDREP